MNTILTQSPIFKGLQPPEVENLLVQVPHQIRHFHKDDLLAIAGEEVKAAMILLEGKLQGEMVDFSGNSLKIEELMPPQMVAAGFLLNEYRGDQGHDGHARNTPEQAEQRAAHIVTVVDVGKSQIELS